MEFVWTTACDQAFEELKARLVSAPVLAHPRLDGRFILDTDASQDGIGAVLSQIQDGEEWVISYGSKLLSSAERHYCITRRELLAVIFFCEQYRHFLVGRKFTVRTDNSAVRYWTHIHSPNYDPHGQVARWISRLSVFDFDIQHRAGTLHGNADGLSRPPFVLCAQCETRHHDGHTSKRQCKLKVPPPPSIAEVSALRVVTRGQLSKLPPSPAASASSWMSGGVILDAKVLGEEQWKDPAIVDGMCWLAAGVRPEKSTVMPGNVDTKYIWSNFDVLVIKDGLLCKQVGPLHNGKMQVTVLVPPSLRREVMRMCHDTKT